MSGFTPGPWAWFGKANCNDVWLGTTHSGRRWVMGFKRWGPQGAQPVFQEDRRLKPASDFMTFEVGEPGVVGYRAARDDPSVYRYDINGISHPDAALIASAPALYAALEEAYRFISQPARMDSTKGGPKTMTYRAEDYNKLTANLRVALALARGEQS